MKTTAKFFSFLFHPLMLPTYAFMMVYFTNPLLFSAYDERQVSQIFLNVILNTLLFPVLSIFLVWKLGFIKSLEMEDSKERLIPYITTGAFYIWDYVVFRKSGYPQILNIIILGATITLFAIFLLNLFKKVSAHTGGMGSFIIASIVICVFTVSNFGFLVMIIVLVAGMVGSSRLFLGAHDPFEVFTGYLTGVMSMLIAIQFY